MDLVSKLLHLGRIVSASPCLSVGTLLPVPDSLLICLSDICLAASTRPSACLLAIFLFACPSILLPVCYGTYVHIRVSACLSICIPLYPYVCLPVYLHVY
jgi:hypothetical protein